MTIYPAIIIFATKPTNQPSRLSCLNKRHCLTWRATTTELECVWRCWWWPFCDFCDLASWNTKLTMLNKSAALLTSHIQTDHNKTHFTPPAKKQVTSLQFDPKHFWILLVSSFLFPHRSATSSILAWLFSALQMLHFPPLCSTDSMDSLKLVELHSAFILARQCTGI